MNLTQQDMAEIQQLMMQIQERRSAMEQLMVQQGQDLDRLNELVGGENMTAENGTNGTNNQSNGEDGGILDMLGDLLGGGQNEQNQSNQTGTSPS